MGDSRSIVALGVGLFLRTFLPDNSNRPVWLRSRGLSTGCNYRSGCRLRHLTKLPTTVESVQSVESLHAGQRAQKHTGTQGPSKMHVGQLWADEVEPRHKEMYRLLRVIVR